MTTLWLFQFLTIEHAEKHIKSCHTDSIETKSCLFIILPEPELRYRFQCNVCSFFYFGSYTVIKQHLRRHRNEENVHVKFECRVCRKEFGSFDSVNLHSKSHNQEYGSLMTRIISKESYKSKFYQKDQNNYRNKTENKDRKMNILRTKQMISPGFENILKIPCIFWNR